MKNGVDELAVRAKTDPIAYRLALLRPDASKLRKPLALLREKTSVDGERCDHV